MVGHNQTEDCRVATMKRKKKTRTMERNMKKNQEVMELHFGQVGRSEQADLFLKRRWEERK